jgi:hypothetical protein
MIPRQLDLNSCWSNDVIGRAGWHASLVADPVKTRAYDSKANARPGGSCLVDKTPFTRMRKEHVSKLGTLQDNGLEMRLLLKFARIVIRNEEFKAGVHGVDQISSLRGHCRIRRNKSGPLAAI